MRNIQSHKGCLPGSCEFRSSKGRDSSNLLFLNTATDEYVCTYHSTALSFSVVLQTGENVSIKEDMNFSFIFNQQYYCENQKLQHYKDQFT